MVGHEAQNQARGGAGRRSVYAPAPVTEAVTAFDQPSQKSAAHQLPSRVTLHDSPHAFFSSLLVVNRAFGSVLHQTDS